MRLKVESASDSDKLKRCGFKHVTQKELRIFFFKADTKRRWRTKDARKEFKERIYKRSVRRDRPLRKFIEQIDNVLKKEKNLQPTSMHACSDL